MKRRQALIFGLSILKVRGQSMSPAFQHGDYVASARWPRMPITVGDVVVVSHPHFDTIIKRVYSMNESGDMQLSGDNILSTEKDSIGWCKKEWISGKVLWRFSASS